MEHCDVLIVGGGAAGMAAAWAACRAGLGRVVLADREERLGGVLPQCIHHGFGLGYFQEDLTGPEYAERWIARLTETAAEVLLETTVLSVSPDRTAVLSGPKTGLRRLAFDKLILATGCRETPIGALPVAGTTNIPAFMASSRAQRLRSGTLWRLSRQVPSISTAIIFIAMNLFPFI